MHLKSYNIEKNLEKAIFEKQKSAILGQNTKKIRKFDDLITKTEKNAKIDAFSLGELLVVLTLVAILAIMLWLIIDPLEQIRKAQDDAVMASAKELAKAITRYHVSTYHFPWNDSNVAYTATVRTEEKAYINDPTLETSNMNWLWNLVDAGEIEENVGQRLINAGYYVYKPTSSNSSDEAWVCFSPISEQFKRKAAQACDNTQRTAPDRYRTFDPCQTNDGSVPVAGSGLRNLLCVTE